MRDNFDTHKWFKKQYIEESMSPEEYAKAKEEERLEKRFDKDKIRVEWLESVTKNLQL